MHLSFLLKGLMQWNSKGLPFWLWDFPIMAEYLGSFSHFVIRAEVFKTYGEHHRSEKPPLHPLDNTTSVAKSPASTARPKIPLADV